MEKKFDPLENCNIHVYSQQDSIAKGFSMSNTRYLQHMLSADKKFNPFQHAPKYGYSLPKYISRGFSTSNTRNSQHVLCADKKFNPSQHDSLYGCSLPKCISREFSTTRNLQHEVTIDKKVIKLMDYWLLKEATDLIVESADKELPSGSTLVSLLQLMGNLGEVEKMLELKNIVLDNSLCTEKRFYHYLCQSYYNSGRIEDAIEYMESMYSERMNFDDIVIIFPPITVMALTNFPHKMHLILDFVRECHERKESPDFILMGQLWKCYMLAGEFLKADHLYTNDQHVKKMASAMVTDIVQDRDDVEYDREAVLLRLLELPALKQRLRHSIENALLEEFGGRPEGDETETGSDSDDTITNTESAIEEACDEESKDVNGEVTNNKVRNDVNEDNGDGNKKDG